MTNGEKGDRINKLSEREASHAESGKKKTLGKVLDKPKEVWYNKQVARKADITKEREVKNFWKKRG